MANKGAFKVGYESFKFRAGNEIELGKLLVKQIDKSEIERERNWAVLFQVRRDRTGFELSGCVFSRKGVDAFGQFVTQVKKIEGTK